MSIVLWKYVIDFFDFIDRMINPREMIDMMTPFLSNHTSICSDIKNVF